MEIFYCNFHCAAHVYTESNSFVVLISIIRNIELHIKNKIPNTNLLKREKVHIFVNVFKGQHLLRITLQ